MACPASGCCATHSVYLACSARLRGAMHHYAVAGFTLASPISARSAPMACPGVKKATKFLWLPLWSLVGVVELESTTSTMSTWRSNQLSYTPAMYCIICVTPLNYHIFCKKQILFCIFLHFFRFFIVFCLKILIFRPFYHIRFNILFLPLFFIIHANFSKIIKKIALNLYSPLLCGIL